MRTNKLFIFSVVVMSLSFVTCKERETILPKKSKDKTITEVIVNTNPKVTATVDGITKKITASVPFATDLSKVTLAITHSGASISPDPKTAQDFSSGKSVKYTVKAEDGSTQDYAVSITVKEQTQFTVSFNTDGGNTIASTKVKKGEKATAPNEPSKAASIFKEWQSDDKTFDFNTPIIKDISLKAIWLEPLNASSTEWDIINSPEGYYIIKYKGSATDVVIPTTVDGNKIVGIKTAISAENIFGGTIFVATNITSIDFSNAVYLKKIDEYAFQYCTHITSITLPNSLSSIGYATFYNCTRLTSVKIPNSVTSIGNGAFSHCTRLTSINIPVSVTSIGNGVFIKCTRLTSITIPNSVTSIGVGVFENCTSLTSITIPNSVTSIGHIAFWKCTSLTSITLSNSLSSIELQTFYGCTALTSITIPNSVTSIGPSAFASCSNLKDVSLSNTLTSIGDYVFANCTSLSSINIPDAVTSIGIKAFFETKITKITLPKKCTYKTDSFDSGVNVINGIKQQ